MTLILSMGRKTQPTNQPTNREHRDFENITPKFVQESVNRLIGVNIEYAYALAMFHRSSQIIHQITGELSLNVGK